MKTASLERGGSEGAESKTRPKYLSTIPGEDQPGYRGAMKAIVQDRYGVPQQVLKLGEVERPPVGDADVLIRVRATSVNTPDWVTVAGVPYIIRLKFGLRKPPIISSSASPPLSGISRMPTASWASVTAPKLLPGQTS